MRSSTIGALILVLVGMTLLIHLNSTSERSPAAYEDSGAWSPTPTIGEAWISAPQPADEAYGEGFNDGYLAACKDWSLSC